MAYFRCGSGGKSEGLYVWEKYSCHKEIGYATIYSSNKVFKIDAASGTNMSKVGISQSFFDTIVNSYYQVKANGIYCYLRGNSTTLYLKSVLDDSIVCTLNYYYNSSDTNRYYYTCTPDWIIESNNISSQKVSDVYYEYRELVIDDFIERLSSDNENEYPDCGVNTDGYYYVKIENVITKLGFSKYVVGTFIPTSSTNELQITHSFGERPRMVILHGVEKAETYVKRFAAVATDRGTQSLLAQGVKGGISTLTNAGYISITDSKVNFSLPSSLIAGYTYGYLILA